MDVKSGNGEKFEFFSNFLAHPVESPWPILTVLYQNVRTFGSAGKTEMVHVAVLCTNETTPIFEFLTPPPPAPGAAGPHSGKGHVGRHWNKIWCGSVHALLRYRSKTTKMQNSPLTPVVTKISLPPGDANPQKGRRHIRNRSTPACKLWRESARGLSRNHWPNKKNKKTYSKTNTSPFTLSSEWRVIIFYKISMI